ncbi:hypothetical protein E2C01_092731 [Portunus trituberculatus]|uniref:Uncharacterized protein n=1 Tax=Portunus trituberculatus TaxID=210409 RepID=A0A5B7JSY7_PORTR|nr:hypothetical protein [Portunus trituberculatus]
MLTSNFPNSQHAKSQILPGEAMGPHDATRPGGAEKTKVGADKTLVFLDSLELTHFLAQCVNGSFHHE